MKQTHRPKAATKVPNEFCEHYGQMGGRQRETLVSRETRGITRNRVEAAMTPGGACFLQLGNAAISEKRLVFKPCQHTSQVSKLESFRLDAPEPQELRHSILV